MIAPVNPLNENTVALARKFIAVYGRKLAGKTSGDTSNTLQDEVMLLQLAAANHLVDLVDNHNNAPYEEEVMRQFRTCMAISA